MPSTKRQRKKAATETSPEPAQESQAPSTGRQLMPEGEGRRAVVARKVYDEMDIRRRILSCLDEPTLAGCMRLEKGAVESVARVLYEKAHISVVDELSETCPRFRTYCDAVRHLDASPYHHPKSDKTVHPKPKPMPFVVRMTTWRTRYPNLITVRRHNPPPGSESKPYHARIDGDDIRVYIEKSVSVEDVQGSTQAMTNLHFPGATRIEGLKVRCAYELVLDPGVHFGGVGRNAEWKPMASVLNKWKRWLCSEKLDRRVVGVHGMEHLNVTLKDVMAFLAARADGECEPLAHLYLPNVETYTSEQFAEIFRLAPRVWSVSISINGTDKLQAVIDAFEGGLPDLEELELMAHLPKSLPTMPLTGLRNLRYLTVKSEGSLKSLAGYICRVGGKHCEYVNESLKSEARARFDDLVHKTKAAAIARN